MSSQKQEAILNAIRFSIVEKQPGILFADLTETMNAIGYDEAIVIRSGKSGDDCLAHFDTIVRGTYRQQRFTLVIRCAKI